MIFWNADRIYAVMRDGAAPEAVYFRYSYRGIRKHKFIRGLIFWISFSFRNKILIYDRFDSYFFRAFPIDRIPIVSEFEDDFPDRFAIKTKNIDLLRELISRGKKVSWFEPDIFTQAHYLGILSFEHVFIDPYINTHIVFPTGEVYPVDEVLKGNAYGGWSIKHMKKIGMNLADINDRIDWKAYRKSRYGAGKSVGKNSFIGKAMFVNLYNIYSITYLIWQQTKLSAMIAEKKTVKRG